MKILFIINDFESLVATQTTTIMMQKALNGHSVYVSGSSDWGITKGSLYFNCRRLIDKNIQLDEMPTFLSVQPAAKHVANTFDKILLRVNFGRTVNHELLRCLIRESDLPLSSAPLGIWLWMSKQSLSKLPESIVGRTYFSRNVDDLISVIDREDKVVIKPACGTRGQGVFLTQKEDPNLREMLETLAKSGTVMVQEYLRDSKAGDTRVLMLDGEILSLNGKSAAIQRIPGARDFRSNIHAGGTATPGQITNKMLTACNVLGPYLLRNGLRFVGADFIGGKLCEVNVCAPGGLVDAERFFNEPYTEYVIEQLTRTDRRSCYVAS